MPKENKIVTTDDDAKKKADKLAAEALGATKVLNKPLADVQEEPVEDNPDINTDDDAKVKVEPKNEYDVFDHMVKVKGKYYAAGERVPK